MKYKKKAASKEEELFIDPFPARNKSNCICVLIFEAGSFVSVRLYFRPWWTLMRRDWNYLLEFTLHIKWIQLLLFWDYILLYYTYIVATDYMGPLVSDIFTNKSLRRIKRINRMKFAHPATRIMVVSLLVSWTLSIPRIKNLIMENNNLNVNAKWLIDRKWSMFIVFIHWYNIQLSSSKFLLNL